MDDEAAESDELTAAERLATAIRRLRTEARLSQKTLANMVGYTREYLSAAERVGGNLPSQALVRALDSALEADGVFLRLWKQAHAERQALRNGAPSRFDGHAAGVEPDRVLLPVVVDGRPGYVPLKTVDRLVDGSSRSDEVAGWEAMRPLNRRALLQHGAGTAALPWFGHIGPTSQAPHGPSANLNTAPPPVTSWASQIHQVVLSPTDAIRQARTMDDGAADVTTLRQSATRVMAAHLASDYATLSTALPLLIGLAESTSLRHDSVDVQTLVSDVYGVAAWSLIKADSSASAWIAAERSIRAAELADDVLRVAAGTRCLSEVHMRASNFEEATRTAFLATVQLDTAPASQRRSAICLRGAALLSGGAAAARRGDSREAYAALKAAAVCGEELREDRTELGAVFGPTNVAIHEVAVAVELGDTRKALRHVSSVNLDRMPAALTERRARFLIDVARSHRGAGDDQAAVDALLQAEQIAADEVREHRLTHELLRDLLRRERRSSGIRELAARCNQLN